MWKKVWAVPVVIVMVVSGFGMFGIGMNDEGTQSLGSIIENEVTDVSYPDTGVLRTVLAEEYTHALCSWCKPTEEKFMTVVENYTYSRIAPALPHVSSSVEAVWAYNAAENNARKSYYNAIYSGGFSYVPWVAFDGRLVTHDASSPNAFIEYLENALGKMARFSITTTGDIGAGTVSAMVEAHDVIEPDINRMIKFSLWENNIDVLDRWGFDYWDSQYFDYYHYAIWDYIPDIIGEQVFPGGANPGDKAWFNRTFTLEPEWNTSEIGVNVWIQDDTDGLVEQAAVEDFDPTTPPAPPTHDIAAYGLTVDEDPLYYKMGPWDEIRANKAVYVNSTILNYGASIENNIQINLLINSVVEDTQMITSLDPEHGQRVSFVWNVPTVEGAYDVGIEAVVVAGETNTTNNLMERDCTVVQLPGLSLNPDSFTLDVTQGTFGFDNLTVSSIDMQDMDYEIDIGNMHEVMGKGDFGKFKYNSNGCGNDYYVTSTTTLHEFRQYLNADPTWIDRIYYLVYERNDSLDPGRYYQIFELNDTTPQTGEGWYSSGPIDVQLDAGCYYYIGIYFVGINPSQGVVEIYWDDAFDLPVQTSFGEAKRGYKKYFVGDYTPDNNFTLYAGGTGVYLQDMITTDNSGSWLSAAPDNGILGAGTNDDVMLTADATSLSAGSYQTNLALISNDPENWVTNIPVNLTVYSAPSAPFDIPVTVPATGWDFISFPLSGVSGDVTTVLDDSQFGDGQTAWDIAQWYDAQNQEWKSYATFKPASLNNMPFMDQTMGVWVHITANGGDGVITTGQEGFYPSMPTSIDLFTGWNMVGYPSATPRLASDTLPAQADTIALFDTGQPYDIRDETVLTGVTMTEGNAYWVHVTTDCTWQVDP